MSTPTNETSRPLMRLVDRLGISPNLELSNSRHWRLVVLGTVLFVLNALPEAGWVSSPADQYARLLWLCLGPILVSQGASGLLLLRGKETISLWFSVLQALLTVPLVAFGFLLLYEWLGLPWAVGVAVAACAIFAVVRKRAPIRRGSVSATPTGQPRSARRLLRRIVGRPPEKPPGKVASAIFLLVFVVGVFLAALSWRGGPSLSDLSIACVMLGGLLFAPMNAAAYHRWWGELTGDLVRLGEMVAFLVGLGLLIAEMALTGAWGWVWWSAFVLALYIVVAVAGHYYGPEDEPHTEDGPPEVRDPID